MKKMYYSLDTKAVGYGLYDIDTDIPNQYRDAIRALYSDIMPDKERRPKEAGYSIRFAPLLDMHLVSVLFFNVKNPVDGRPNQDAAVIFLLEPEDINPEFFNSFYRELSGMADWARGFMGSKGYEVYQPEFSKKLIGKETDRLSDECTHAMLLATASAMETNPGAHPGTQIYIGFQEGEESPEATVSLWMNSLPWEIQKNLSFYIGAYSAQETRGVSLVFTERTILKNMSINNDFGNGPRAAKTVLLDNVFFNNTPAESLWTVFSKKKYDNIRLGLRKFLHEEPWITYRRAVEIIVGDSLYKENDPIIFPDDIYSVMIEKKMFPEAYLCSAAKELGERKTKAGKALSLYLEKGEEEKEEKKTVKKEKKKAEKKPSRTKESSKKKVKDEQMEKEKKVEKKEEGRRPSRRKFLLLMKCLLCALLPIVLFIIMASWGIRVAHTPKVLTISFDMNVLLYLLSLLIVTAVNLPLGYILFSSLKELSGESDSE